MPEFGAPELLVLLGAVPLTAALLALGRRARRRDLVRFLGESQWTRLADLPPSVWRAAKAGLLLGAVGLLTMAAARPQWGSEPSALTREGADVVIVLDASLSMAATDVQPNRMAHAQEHLARALERLQGDRVGLILFGADARLRFPLTTDTAAAEQLIRLTRPGDRLVGQGTAIGAALEEAERAFDDDDEARGRAVVLVTDGENLAEEGPPRLTGFSERDIVLYTVGVGTVEGSTIPVEGATEGTTTVKVDADTGQPVITRLNEPFLRDLARAGGGSYYHLGPNDDLSGLVADIDRMERARLAERESTRPIERFQWALLPALVLLVSGLFLPDSMPRLPVPRRRPRPGSALPLLLILALVTPVAVACRQTVESLNQEGNRRYEDGRFQEALEKYQRAQVERPDLYPVHYNTGNALHRLQQYDRAVEETRRALSSPDPTIRFRAYYALGNHYYRLGRFQEAYEAYKSALKEHPSDRDAKINLELVLARMQPPQTPDGGGEQGGNAPRPPAGGAPAPGAAPPPQGPEATSEQPKDEADMQVQEALRDFVENGTIEDAIRVLDALEDRRNALQDDTPRRRDTAGQGGW